MSIESQKNKIGQSGEDGGLGPIEEACILRAEKTFRIRSKTDTNPAIVQMISRGQPIEHWYYRSDQWIDQPYFKLGVMRPYVGPANKAQKFMYGEGKFIVDQEAIEDCIANYEEKEE